MRWRPSSQPEGCESLAPGARLVEECAASLTGAYPARLARSEREIPTWVLLNPVAHLDRPAIETIAAHARPGDRSNHGIGWEQAATLVATDVLDTEHSVHDLASCQHGALVPIGLDVAAGSTPSRHPRRPAGHVRQALTHAHRHPQGGDPRDH